MDSDFWHEKWKVKDIGFHQVEVNPLLEKYFKKLHLEKGSRVFVPLCGKTLDIAWLLSEGYRVAGAELSEIAVEELFTELGMTRKVKKTGKLKHYSGNNIDIFVGDIFDLSGTTLGSIDAIYDRAALVALPENMRQQYTSHLIRVTNKASQLIICFEYDQTLQAGPPFSIDANEINRHYANVYQLNCIDSVDVAGGLKGKCAAKENVWIALNE